MGSCGVKVIIDILKVNKLTFSLFFVVVIFGFYFFTDSSVENNLKEPEIVKCEITNVVKTVRGVSMSPLLEPEQDVLMLEGYYDCHPPVVNDVVILKPSYRETPLIKVVKAVSGDELALEKIIDDTYQIVVNGLPIVNSAGDYYLLPENQAKLLSLYIGVIPEKACLVLGDNTKDSYDSADFGLISTDILQGKVEL